MEEAALVDSHCPHPCSCVATAALFGLNSGNLTSRITAFAGFLRFGGTWQQSTACAEIGCAHALLGTALALQQSEDSAELTALVVKFSEALKTSKTHCADPCHVCYPDAVLVMIPDGDREYANKLLGVYLRNVPSDSL